MRPVGGEMRQRFGVRGRRVFERRVQRLVVAVLWP